MQYFPYFLSAKTLTPAIMLKQIKSSFIFFLLVASACTYTNDNSAQKEEEKLPAADTQEEEYYIPGCVTKKRDSTSVVFIPEKRHLDIHAYEYIRPPEVWRDSVVINSCFSDTLERIDVYRVFFRSEKQFYLQSFSYNDMFGWYNDTLNVSLFLGDSMTECFIIADDLYIPEKAKKNPKKHRYIKSLHLSISNTKSVQNVLSCFDEIDFLVVSGGSEGDTLDLRGIKVNRIFIYTYYSILLDSGKVVLQTPDARFHNVSVYDAIMNKADIMDSISVKKAPPISR